MSKSARPNKARHWLKNPLPWLKNALPWLWSDDSISKHIRYGSALLAMLVFGLGGWAATDQIVSAVIAQGSVAIESNVKKVQHPTGGVVGQPDSSSFAWMRPQAGPISKSCARP
jgi:hypothetical protein